MKALKILGFVFGGLVLLVLSAVTVVTTMFPKSRPPQDVKVESSPERLARGEYLVKHVGACFNCHSERDWSLASAPMIPGTAGGTGFCVTEKDGYSGTICAPNITPHETGIGSWSDGELIRAVREGVSRDGRALFPMMPYTEYRELSDEDTRAMVAYLRSLQPVAHKGGKTDLRPPMSLIARLLPTPVESVPQPPSTGPEHGRYLATIAGCKMCHTAQGGEPFAGGFEFPGPWGRVFSPNITPDAETGIGKLSREAFIAMFKAHEAPDESPPPADGTGTIMPWGMLAGMSEADLGSIYDYLKTVPAQANAVQVRPATAAR